MKKILNFIVATCILTGIAHFAVAQGKLNEGKITYDITYPGTELDENVMAMLPSEAVMFFKKGKSRMEMKTGMGMTTTISDAKEGSSVTLMDMMGNKIAMKMTADKSKGEKPDVKITDETKDIAGYKCTKAVVTLNDAEKSSFNVWFTKEIEAPNDAKNQIEGIDGLMMEFQVKQQGMNMKMAVRNVEKQDVEDSKFIVPGGYKEMTMEDLKRMSGGK